MSWHAFAQTPGHAWCSRCKQEKPVEAFWKSSSTRTGVQSVCISCGRSKSERLRKRPYYGHAPTKRREGSAHNTIHVKVFRAVRKGLLTKRPCEVCGAVKVDAHHDDYTKPLEVRWLCREHHMAHHHGCED